MINHINSIALALLCTSCTPVVHNGVDGKDGKPGTPGTSCTVTTVSSSSVAPNGGAQITCEDGTSSLALNGTPGANGTPGTVVAPVQFCPGTPSYPSTFIEVGFCIDNTLYAVYSQNNGFLVKLLPGSYQSEAIGSRCTFVVQPNCVIVR